MTIGWAEWIMHQGYTWVRKITVRDKDTKVAKDISSYTFKMTVKRFKHDTDANALHQEVVNVGTATGGTTQVVITAANTAVVPVGNWYFDINYTDASGAKTELIEGNLNVKKAVTRSP